MDGSLAGLVDSLVRRADVSRVRRDVEILAQTPRNRRWHPEALEAAQDHVVAELSTAGWSVERQPFTSPWRVASNDRADLAARLLRVRAYRGLSGVNLVARRPGTGPPVVVGAHLDTVRNSPGADDNASGVAALLEVARLIGPTAGPVVLAVLDLEELGLVGAAHLARRLTAQGPVAAMIGLESVGCYSDQPQRLPAGADRAFPAAARAVADGGGRGDFTLVVHRRSSGTAARTWEAAAAQAGHRSVLLRDPRRDGLAGSLSTVVRPQTVHLGRSDHAAFWRRGVPSLMLTDTASFRNPAYHTRHDLPETLNYAALSQVAVATAATVLSLQSGTGGADGDARPGAPR
jgi:acetylornithine deacetylase/succinyl-diaminopimelate desuccinylase-like protein